MQQIGEAHGYDVSCFLQLCPVSGTAPNTPVHGTSCALFLFFVRNISTIQPPPQKKTTQNMILQKYRSTQYYFLK